MKAKRTKKLESGESTTSEKAEAQEQSTAFEAGRTIPFMVKELASKFLKGRKGGKWG